MSLTTESPGRAEAPVITSTPAVAQVVPVKNSYYRKNTSNEKAHGQMGLDSLFRQIHLQEGNLELKPTPIYSAICLNSQHMPVPSPEEGGGLDEGLAAHLRKKLHATETLTKNRTTNSALGEDGSPAGRCMTRIGESRKEATLPTTILSTRATIKIGTWNVKTMYEIGKTAQVAAEMRAYKLDILGISEARWIRSGEKLLASGETLLFSGHEGEKPPHTEGVALMLSKTARKALIGWQPHGPRILTASFRTNQKRITLNIVYCYSPTNTTDDAIKDQFYSRLQAVLDKNFLARDVNVLMGDLNAKIGTDNAGFEEVMGCHGLGQMNENGERLANLCATNSIAIG